MTVPTVVAALSVLVVLQHVLMSHPGVREALVERLGEMAFKGLYSLATVLVMGPWGWLWWTHRHTGDVLWQRTAAVTHGGELVNVLAFALLVAGAIRPAPSSMAARGEPRPTGVLAVTRHPVSMGIGLWSLTHAALNPWTVDLAFFCGMATLAIGGALHQDWRKKASDERYLAFARQTSILPLPTRLGSVGAKGWSTMALGVGVAIAIRLLHPVLFALPGE